MRKYAYSVLLSFVALLTVLLLGHDQGLLSFAVGLAVFTLGLIARKLSQIHAVMVDRLQVAHDQLAVLRSMRPASPQERAYKVAPSPLDVGADVPGEEFVAR